MDGEQAEGSDLDEFEFSVFKSIPIKHCRKINPRLDELMRQFEERHGAEQTELVMLMSYGVRNVRPIDERLELVYRLADVLLGEANATRQKSQARAAAAVRHAENHAMKAMVFEWLDANFTPRTRSMDDVAHELAGRLVPAKFATVRAWITDWRKLRSTRTA